MSIYATGDIQGCYTELQQLLEQIRFDPAQNQPWCWELQGGWNKINAKLRINGIRLSWHSVKNK